MLEAVKRKDFAVLKDSSLIWTCIEPTIRQVQGKNFHVKAEAYSQLTIGQRALFMFQVLYGHTSNGVGEFYSSLSYLLSNKDVWTQLKKAMEYFGDYDMCKIVEKMDLEYQKIKIEKVEEGAEQDFAVADIISKNAELYPSISFLNKELTDTLSLTIKRVAAYVRNNADEFVLFID